MFNTVKERFDYMLQIELNKGFGKNQAIINVHKKSPNLFQKTNIIKWTSINEYTFERLRYKWR